MKNLLMGILAVAITFSATAQNGKKNKKELSEFKKDKVEQNSYKKLRGERLDDVQTSLNLTDNQGQKIKAANQDFRSKMQAIKRDEQLTSIQKRERVEELQKQHNESIKAVLTEEQRNKLQQQKKSRRNSK